MKKKLKNFEKLRKELTEEFGKIRWYNDKRVTFERRIKIVGVSRDDNKREKMFNFLVKKGYNVKHHINNFDCYCNNYKCLVVYFGE